MRPCDCYFCTLLTPLKICWTAGTAARKISQTGWNTTGPGPTVRRKFPTLTDSDTENIDNTDIRSSEPIHSNTKSTTVNHNNETNNTTNSNTDSNSQLVNMMKEMIQKQDHMNSKICSIGGLIANLDLTLTEHSREMQKINSNVVTLKQQMLQQSRVQSKRNWRQPSIKIDYLKTTVNLLERQSRERNIRLVGYTENQDEVCKDIVKAIMKDKLRIDIKIEAAHRTGRPQHLTKKPWHILFRVATLEEKVKIMRNQRYASQNELYYITDDMTKEDMKTKRQPQPIIQQARDENKKFRFTKGKLYNPKYDHAKKRLAPKTSTPVTYIQ